ncbi:MAG: ArsR family transcriptional regulator [Candidatus Omnitrophica bacterium]|nr:ArsR family transcriptional regulator [Candidatus Omnitrophota bacterium]
MEEIRDRLIELAVNIGESLGLNRAVCQIYALLYLSDAPLSPTEIGKNLEMSKGNVSINLRILEQWNAVRKVWKKGYTRPLYIANENIEEIILDKLKTGIEKRLGYVRPIIKQISKDGNKKLNSTNEKIFSRINKIEKLIEKIEFFLRNFETIRTIAK